MTLYVYIGRLTLQPSTVTTHFCLAIHSVYHAVYHAFCRVSMFWLPCSPKPTPCQAGALTYGSYVY